VYLQLIASLIKDWKKDDLEKLMRISENMNGKMTKTNRFG
jgi:hypothetical protein